ncbi:UDP-glucose 4-epimerase GalE [Idiomarina xiamenensis]|uniref:UDP-glucose 4-epimerase n=1 Tax=Idiomarina xiamenensis 10-D-4 TaxID=740709 RepID=K2KHJ7_9GAMM|nr:UDP-glucose 4-epimerase GalE [Idiomarina xiamenensis]EKE82129.1 UDP-galactose 4-epimerase [Idiomarina xiamenensis 10-D-4]
MATALVTGGAGYIGSHAVLVLLERGWDVVVVDNYSNSCEEPLRRIEAMTAKSIKRYQADIRDQSALAQIFAAHSIDVVFHFAGWKAVGESTEKPLDYYQNNVGGTLALLDVMRKHDVFKLIFSSSATVYGDPDSVPINEQAPTRTTNPYGASKLAVENILTDIASWDTRWSFAILRYFNPVGAHESGMIGEDPNGIPNNLLPYIAQVAVGKLPQLQVFGDDYDTPDGTGVRDYIHVMDLVEGHVDALQVISQRPGMMTVNLGTGQGYSVLEMVKAFEQVSGKPVPYRVGPRRAGDIATCYADPRLAKTILGWSAERDLSAMIRDTWRWQQKNPSGYLGN